MKVSALGSYPRIGEGPENQRLRRAIQQWQAGRMGDEEFHNIQDEVTREAIRAQEEAGCDWITDGMIRWEDGQTYFTDRLSGFHRGGLLRYFDTNTYYRQPVVDGPVSWKEPIIVADFEFAAKNSSRPVRPVVTGPFTLSSLSLDEHYGDAKALVADLTVALNQELKALAAAGATMIQVDEPILTRDAKSEPWVTETFAKLTEGVTTPLWLALFMGPVIPLLDRLQAWPFAGVWLDCVTDPATVDKLASMSFPADKELGLGIVNARNTRLESVDDISSALRKVTEKTPADQIVVTTSAGLEFLPRDRAQQKLSRMSEAVAAFSK